MSIYNEFGIIESNIQTNPFRKRNNEKIPFINITTIDEWVHLISENIKMLLANRFIWEGLPEHIPIDFIERTLAEKGELVLFKDKLDGFFILPGTGKGLNCYGEYTSFQYESGNIRGEVSLTGKNEKGEIKQKALVLRNNVGGKSERLNLLRYVYELADIKSTIAINRQLKKTPFLLEGSDERVIKSLYEQITQIAQGRVFIALDSSLSIEGDGVKAVDLNVTNHTADLQQEYDDYKSELLEVLGINTNPNPNKKERMITDEVGTNNQETNLYRNMRLRLREDVAKKASKLFDMNIKVFENSVFEEEEELKKNLEFDFDSEREGD